MTDNEKLIEEAAQAIHASVVSASSAGAIEIAVNTEGIEFEKALARVSLAVFEKAHAPTDDGRTSEEQEEQRHGDRDADHEEQQTDDRAATRRLGVAGSHAKIMAQAPSDGKRAISGTPTDDKRIDQAIAYIRASWLGTGEPTRNTPAGEIIAILRGDRGFEVPEPQGEQSNALRVEFEMRIRRAVAYGRGIERNRDLSSQQQADWIQEQVGLAASSRAALRAAEGIRSGDFPRGDA